MEFVCQLSSESSIMTPRWWDFAACKGADTTIFFEPLLACEAAEFCDRCPVIKECRAEAEATPTVGFFAGEWHDFDKRKIRRVIREEERRTRCGSVRGYTLHKRRGEDACFECKQARREFFKEVRASIAEGASNGSN